MHKMFFTLSNKDTYYSKIPKRKKSLQLILIQQIIIMVGTGTDYIYLFFKKIISVLKTTSWLLKNKVEKVPLSDRVRSCKKMV